MTQYKLHYFPLPLRGRGELIRYILHYAEVPYEEVAFPLDDFFVRVKKEMPMGVVPVLEFEDGRKLSQSLAIARYLAKKHGLLSDDDFQNAWGDQLACAVEDLYPTFHQPCAVALWLENDEEKMKTMWEEKKLKLVIPLFEKFELFLGDKMWFCGDKVHWSDLVIAEFVDRIDTVFEKGFSASKFPRLHAHCRRIHEIPSIKKYAETRPPHPF